MIHLFDDFPQQVVVFLLQGNKFIDPGINQIENNKEDRQIKNNDKEKW